MNTTHTIKSPSVFANVKKAEEIEIFARYDDFKVDTFEKKIFLAIGVYRDAEGLPWVLPVVRSIEEDISQDKSLCKDYLPTLGLEAFTKSATKLLLGEDSPAIFQGRSLGVQCVAGSGALRVGAEFLAKFLHKKVFYISNPTWENHERIFFDAGFETCCQYRYWNKERQNLDIEGLLEDLERAPQESVIVLHVCSHNPTGIDPTHEQWEKIAEVIKRRRLFPFFDCAYCGIATGDIDEDSYAVRRFVKLGMEMCIAQGFSKIFGMYCERIGNLTFVVQNPDSIPAIKSQVTTIIRSMYHSPPILGARIISYVLNNKDMYNQWRDHLNMMVGRIKYIRKALKDVLDNLETPGNWNHLTNGKGVYLYSGLSEVHANRLLEKYHIYILKNGRITLAGINASNIHYIARAINETIRALY